MTSRTLWRSLRDLEKAVYVDIVWLLTYTLAGGLAPLWFAWAYKAIKTETFPFIGDFAQAGEFALYAAAVIAPAAFLLAHDRQKTPFPGRVGFFLVCIGLIAGAVFAYTIVVPESFAPRKATLGGSLLYEILTMILFAASTLFFVVVSILDATRPIRDVRKIDDRQVGDLSRRISELPR